MNTDLLLERTEEPELEKDVKEILYDVLNELLQGKRKRKSNN